MRPAVFFQLRLRLSLQNTAELLNPDSLTQTGTKTGGWSPDTFELSMNIGLDVKTWLKEDLVEILIAGGGYALFTVPVAEITKVAHGYDVPVYPCINWAQLLNSLVVEGSSRRSCEPWRRSGTRRAPTASTSEIWERPLSTRSATNSSGYVRNLMPVWTRSVTQWRW